MILIIQNTPIWVWVLLVILSGRGLQALHKRQVSYRRILILPMIFSIWSLSSIITQLNELSFAFGGFSMGVAAGFVFAYGLYLAIAYRTTYDATTGLLECPGSTVPLIMILTAFLLKYSLSVYLALNRESAYSREFCAFYGAISGFVSGMFWGRAFYMLWPFRREFTNG